jgi:glycerophosphoryl diester phosphodiesterase
MSLYEPNNNKNDSKNLEKNSEKEIIKSKNGTNKNMDIIEIKSPIDLNEKGKIKINTSELFSNGNSKDSERRIVNVSSIDLDSLKQKDLDNNNILELINKENEEPVLSVGYHNANTPSLNDIIKKKEKKRIKTKKVLMTVIPVTIIFVATIIIFYKLFNN